MARLGVIITDEMEKGLKRVGKRTGATTANMVRAAILQFLKANGEKIEEVDVQWGGERHRAEADDKEESAA